MGEMNIVWKSLADITPYENNPRLNDEAVPAVAASIKEFGWKVPLVIDSDGVIIAGHTRYKAAGSLGLKKVPCIIADDLNKEQVNAFRLADNKVGELATWDLDALKIELDNIGEIDMSEFGFDLDDIDEEPIERPDVTINDEYCLTVECDTEEHLQALYERLQSEGYKCRVSTL